MGKKKYFMTMVSAAMVGAMVFTGCGAASSSETASKSAAAESGASAAQESTASATEQKNYTIGYSAYAMQQEWYQNISAGADAEAKSLGITLQTVDADTNSATQLEAIENFITQKVDAIIISPVEAEALVPVVKEAEEAGIKVICESNMIEGADTVVGISNYEAAYNVGQYFADYCKENSFSPKMLILGYESLENCRQRVEGFKAGMDDAGVEYEVLTEQDGGFREASLTAATDAFTAHPEINSVFGINDDSTIGAVEAAKALGMDLDAMCAITYGLEGIAGRTALYNGGAYKFALASFPEAVGVSCVDAAVEAIEGKELPEQYESPTAIVSQEDFKDYFVQNGEKWDINFDKLAELSK